MPDRFTRRASSRTSCDIPTDFLREGSVSQLTRRAKQSSAIIRALIECLPVMSKWTPMLYVNASVLYRCDSRRADPSWPFSHLLLIPYLFLFLQKSRGAGHD